jgi:hypothetical protein
VNSRLVPVSHSQRLLASNVDESIQDLSPFSGFSLRWDSNREFISKLSMTTTSCYERGILDGPTLNDCATKNVTMRTSRDLRMRE